MRWWCSKEGSWSAASEPRYSWPGSCVGCEDGEGEMGGKGMRCMGVIIACMISGGMLSNRIMILVGGGESNQRVCMDEYESRRVLG